MMNSIQKQMTLLLLALAFASCAPFPNPESRPKPQLQAQRQFERQPRRSVQRPVQPRPATRVVEKKVDSTACPEPEWTDEQRAMNRKGHAYLHVFIQKHRRAMAVGMQSSMHDDNQKAFMLKSVGWPQVSYDDAILKLREGPTPFNVVAMGVQAVKLWGMGKSSIRVLGIVLGLPANDAKDILLILRVMTPEC